MHGEMSSTQAYNISVGKLEGKIRGLFGKKPPFILGN
jgi:hypothetical protein